MNPCALARRRWAAVLLASAILQLAGCELMAALHHADALACKDDGACPVGLRCRAGICSRPPVDAGVDAATGDSGAPDRGPPLTALDLSLGYQHGCALLESGALKCWGLNESGQLGLGDLASRGNAPGEMGDNLPAVDLGAGGRATAVACGGLHTCALLDGGAVKCWGLNEHGQLGIGDTRPRGGHPADSGDGLLEVALGHDRSARAIASGYAHSCALLDDGAIKCWGENDYGQLGLGDTEHRGDDPGEMGNLLSAVDLGSARGVVQIALGWYHSCALLDDGTVKCWGYNGSGQLGQGDTEHRGDEPGEMGVSLPTVELGSGRRALSVIAGGLHSCALLDSGAVKCWGYNFLGQLGLGDVFSRGDDRPPARDAGAEDGAVDAAGEMGDQLPAVDLELWSSVLDLGLGGLHTCARLADLSLRCWGYNGWGQLGLEDTATRGDEPGEMGAALPAVSVGSGQTVQRAYGGGEFTCALLGSGRVKCWGDNLAGQLGLGDEVARGDRPAEMGDDLPALDLGSR